MSIVMNNDIKRWIAKRKAAIIINMIRGKTTVSTASRTFDFSTSEIESRANEVER